MSDPNRAALLEILDRNPEVLTSLQESGDDGSAIRPIEHFVYFLKGRHAKASAKELASLGYETSISKDGRLVCLRATKDGQATLEATTQMTTEVFAVTVVGHGGHYDGWGCPVVEPEA